MLYIHTRYVCTCYTHTSWWRKKKSYFRHIFVYIYIYTPPGVDPDQTSLCTTHAQSHSIFRSYRTFPWHVLVQTALTLRGICHGLVVGPQGKGLRLFLRLSPAYNVRDLPVRKRHRAWNRDVYNWVRKVGALHCSVLAGHWCSIYMRDSPKKNIGGWRKAAFPDDYCADAPSTVLYVYYIAGEYESYDTPILLEHSWRPRWYSTSTSGLLSSR